MFPNIYKMTSGLDNGFIRHQILDGRLVIYVEDRLVYPAPEGGKGAVVLKGTLHFGYATLTFFGVWLALPEPDHAADGDILGLAQEEIAAVIAALGIDQTAAFQLTEDDFQKPEGDRLRLGDFGDLDRPHPDPSGKLYNGAEGVLISLG